jgi:signal transduction histidine kinase
VEQAAKLRVDAQEALHKIRAHWLARVIHDFRGPLFAARGYTRLLLDNKAGDVTATQKEYLTQVIENVNKLSDLLNTFHDFPSDEALHLDVADLSELLRCAVEQCQARDNTLQFMPDLPPHPVITIADSAKLMLATHKLLGMAVDFSRPRGAIQVHARQEDDEFNIKIESNRSSSANSPAPQVSMDITMAADILRLHGGAVQLDARQSNQRRIAVRIPLVNFTREREGK